jgi:hypothetical protein
MDWIDNGQTDNIDTPSLIDEYNGFRVVELNRQYGLNCHL